jgi:hypothetical protein
MVCEMKQGDGGITYADYVVKLYGDVPLGTAMLAREIFAGLLGTALGLNIPAMAIVNIAAELAEEADDLELATKVKRSTGYNFGSSYIPANATFRFIADNLRQAAADVFAFDMLIQNVDRTRLKPNMLQRPDELVIIDHEKAFMCARPQNLLGVIPKPWELETVVPKNHLLFSELKGTPASFDEFALKLAAISQPTLDTIVAQIPSDWISDEIGHIQAHILAASANAEKFKRSVQEVLA